jgi:hypothetical protein
MGKIKDQGRAQAEQMYLSPFLRVLIPPLQALGIYFTRALGSLGFNVK